MKLETTHLANEVSFGLPTFLSRPHDVVPLQLLDPFGSVAAFDPGRVPHAPHHVETEPAGFSHP